MAARRMGIIAFLLCFCLCFIPQYTHAVSTTEAKEPIAVDNECTLTVCYRSGETAFSGQTVKLYKVADVSADCHFTLTESFGATGLILNGVQTNGEWDVIRATLEAHILADNLLPTQSTRTDDLGQACFAQLSPGLYLVSGVEVAQEELTCAFDSTLVVLPGLAEDGLWQYQVTVSAKLEVLPPVQPDEDIQLTVLKLWKGDEGAERPATIEVEIFRDGVSVETVVLSEENHWSYSWTTKDDGASWNVIERNVPSGYTMTVNQRETTFVVINTWTPDDPGTPKPPETGDTANILFYTVLMYASGAILILLGVAGKRKHHEKTN